MFKLNFNFKKKNTDNKDENISNTSSLNDKKQAQINNEKNGAENNVVLKKQLTPEEKQQLREENKHKKQLKRQVQLNAYLNYINDNMSIVIRYTIIALLICGLIFLVFMLLPEDTKNGVSDNYLIKNNKQSKEIAFNISVIPNKYTDKQTNKYILDVLNYIDRKNEQEIYRATIDFVNDNCSLKKNKNTQLLFDVLYEKVHTKEFIAKLDGENRIKQSNLLICDGIIEQLKQDQVQSSNNNQINNDDDSKDIRTKEIKKLQELIKNRDYYESQLDLIEQSKQFDKDAFGDAYDVKNGEKLYETKTNDEKDKEQNLKYRIENLKSKLRTTNQEIQDMEEKIYKSASNVATTSAPSNN